MINEDNEYKIRLVEEYTDLSDKLFKLRYFYDYNKEKLIERKCKIIEAQLSSMWDYKNSLQERIVIELIGDK